VKGEGGQGIKVSYYISSGRQNIHYKKYKPITLTLASWTLRERTHSRQRLKNILLVGIYFLEQYDK